MARALEDIAPAGGSADHPSISWLVLVNRDAGTVRSTGAAAIRARIADRLKDRGRLDIQLVDGGEIVPRAAKAIAQSSHDVIVVGGGDGSLSGVAQLAAGTDVTIGVLPLGTMNMVAKSLNLDSDFESALHALRTAIPRSIDVGRVNDRVFLHQVSFGIQPRAVRVRDRIGFGSRLTKVLSTFAAFASVMMRHRSLKIVCQMNGKVERIKVQAIAISNNLFRDEQIAVSGRLDGGVLGVYRFTARHWKDYLRIVVSALRGTWKHSDHVETGQAGHVRLAARQHKGKLLATVDGELVYLTSPIDIRIVPRSLRMLVPLADEPHAAPADLPQLQRALATATG
ncbi:MAG TPA: diacylglycerol kinase family protein [Aestuariivirga sp.]|nr:diacylglycerol kinase family protein [Aestuariivirga sp.]